MKQGPLHSNRKCLWRNDHEPTNRSLGRRCLLCSSWLRACALQSLRAREWPKSWPTELEPIRKQARTYEGPTVLYRFYLIPFTKREEFEAAWPQLLKVKSKGTPIVLVRGPKTDFFAVQPAGVLIRTPPVNESPGPKDGVPITDAQKADGEWRTKASYIELVVDGEIVDLNRIQIPADTLIIDERFKEEKKK